MTPDKPPIGPRLREARHLTIGFFTRRGYYLEDAVQVFNRGQRGGAYWFTRGVDYRSLGAWIPAAVIGLLFVNLPGQWEGPLPNVADDVGIAGVLYVVLSALFPEPRALYGPEGPRWFPASDAAIPPIAGRMRPAAGNPEAERPETGNPEVPVAGSSG